jgi:heme A synthase
MPGIIFVSGLAVTTAGLIACASCLDLEAAQGLLAAAAIAVLGVGVVLALIGVQLVIRPLSAPVSTAQLLASSVTRSAVVMLTIGAAIAWRFGHPYAFDLAPIVGQAFIVVVVVDLVVYLGALFRDPSLRPE